MATQRFKQKLMRSIAVSRVLDNRMARMEIGSPGDLREAYQQELAANRAEIEAIVARSLAGMEEGLGEIPSQGPGRAPLCGV